MRVIWEFTSAVVNWSWLYVNRATRLVVGVYIELDLEKTSLRSVLARLARKDKGQLAILSWETYFFAR
jgi:hypothetical protein